MVELKEGAEYWKDVHVGGVEVIHFHMLNRPIERNCSTEGFQDISTHTCRQIIANVQLAQMYAF